MKLKGIKNFYCPESENCYITGKDKFGNIKYDHYTDGGKGSFPYLGLKGEHHCPVIFFKEFDKCNLGRHRN